ncbi:DUF4190 domain-containing protein [Streptomyces sp. NPDC047002]|uniref:DUF4190 domain-containing protein n=1 Tax=Streptomyces sp. NPDC047002 TaxID=3155475 RepID=UPI003455EED3
MTSPSGPSESRDPSDPQGGPGRPGQWGPGDASGGAYGAPAAPPYAEPARPARGNGLAVAALVLGIAAIVLFWTVFGGIVLGLVAIVLGALGSRRARRDGAPRRGMAITGVVLGALGLIAGGLILALGVSFLNSDSFKSYSDCVKHAHSTADRRQCADDFSHRTTGN